MSTFGALRLPTTYNNHPSNEKKTIAKTIAKTIKKTIRKTIKNTIKKDHADIDVHDVVGVLRLLDPSRDRSEEHEEQEW